MARFARLALTLAIYAAVIVTADLVGSALHSHQAAAATPAGDCPLLSDVRTPDGRAIVTYSDDTHDARMASAISAAVAQWNNTLSDVRLVPDSNFAALTFSAGTRSPSIPVCESSAARTLRIELSKPLWSGTSGQTVADPVASIAKDLGRALGLHGGGSCPDLMTPAACPSRNHAPTGPERALVERMYAHAP